MTLMPLAWARKSRICLTEMPAANVKTSGCARGRVEQRLGRLFRALLHLLDLRLRPRGLRALPELLLEIRGLRGGMAVGRVERRGPLGTRRRPPRGRPWPRARVALSRWSREAASCARSQRDLVDGRVRIRLQRLGVVLHGRVPVARARGLLGPADTRGRRRTRPGPRWPAPALLLSRDPLSSQASNRSIAAAVVAGDDGAPGHPVRPMRRCPRPSTYEMSMLSTLILMIL